MCNWLTDRYAEDLFWRTYLHVISSLVILLKKENNANADVEKLVCQDFEWKQGMGWGGGPKHLAHHMVLSQKPEANPHFYLYVQLCAVSKFNSQRFTVSYSLRQGTIYCIIWFQNNMSTKSHYIFTTLDNMSTQFIAVSQWMWTNIPDKYILNVLIKDTIWEQYTGALKTNEKYNI